MTDPKECHMKAAIRVLRYLGGTRDWCLQFGGRGSGGADVQHPTANICCYADSDWASSKDDRKSITGWVAKLNGDPISWASKKQSIVAQSSCEAELYAEASAINEVLWLKGLLEEIQVKVPDAPVICGDNQSTQTISKNNIKTERTKHVDVKYHFINETVNDGTVKLKWVPTTQQEADVFTKALDRVLFQSHRSRLMVQRDR